MTRKRCPYVILSKKTKNMKKILFSALAMLMLVACNQAPKGYKINEKIHEVEITKENRIINLETITAYNNIEEIFSQNQDFLDTVVIGRSDFSSSCGIPKSEVNGSKMLDYCRDIIEKSNDYGFNSAFGGSISVDSLDFFNELRDITDRIETRKIVFDIDKLGDNYKIGVKKAIDFEYLYLKNKVDYYQSVVNEDKARFLDLKKRVNLD